METNMSWYGKSEKQNEIISDPVPLSACVPYLKRLLGSLAAGADGLGVKLEVGPTRVHVVQMCTVLVKPETEFLDMNLTKDSTFQSLFYWRVSEKTIPYSTELLL
jgi:hypothetical protein